MYLDDIANEIRSCIPIDRQEHNESDDLFRIYAVLLRAKGVMVTESDVHDAWCTWKYEQKSSHDSLVEYEKLPIDVQKKDKLYTEAIRSAAKKIGMTDGSVPAFEEVLFPNGKPTDESSSDEILELYKVMVDSSERLVGRRQAVNTLFITINGALFTASGFIFRSQGDIRFEAFGVLVLCMTGILLSVTWISLIISFGQLNTGKFKVINYLEQYLSAALYRAEWEALGRGQNPKIYRSFTLREIRIPKIFILLYFIAAVVAMSIVLGGIPIGSGTGIL